MTHNNDSLLYSRIESYNLLTSIGGLSQFASPNHQIREIELHGNELKQTNEIINSLINVKTLKRISIKQNPIEGCNQLIHKQLPQLEAIDGENKFGATVGSLPPLATLELPETPPEITSNPWSTQPEIIPQVRKHVLASTENISTKIESQQLETNSRIENLENLIQNLLKEKNKISVNEKKVKKNPEISRKSKSCSSCSKLFEEIKLLQSFCDKYQIEIGNMKDSQNRINLERDQREQDLKNLLSQKCSQLEASLETGSKFKIYFKNEKEKSETLEHSIARLTKDIQKEKNINSNLKQEIQSIKNINEKIAKNCTQLPIELKKPKSN